MATLSVVYSLTKSKLSSLPLSHITRRGYSESVGLSKGRCMVSTVVGPKVEDQRSSSEPSISWAPDPQTGYYRPANRVEEIDPVELRKMLLNHKA